ANMVTGDFSVALGEAYLIEKGELGPAVKQAMVSGNFAEVFSNIVAASKEKTKKGSLITGRLLVELNISG
ncbi:MAG: TldD/PmbA family protein, partial [Thermoprotei archaeon]